MVSPLLRPFFRIRYWIAGGSVGGGLTLAGWYEDWRKKFPSFELPEWIHPSQLTEKYTSLKPQFDASKWKDKLRENFKSFDPSTSRGPIGLPFQYNLLYNVGASSADVDFPSSNQSATNFDLPQKPHSSLKLLSLFSNTFGANKEPNENEKPLSEMNETERIQKLQEELLKTQMQYQRELEHLEKENKVLKQRLLIRDIDEQRRAKKLKRSLIDMYSEMLDMLIHYDSSYGTTDNLPRVVVVGDQSAGKTSVLEMIAQARIFPRGSGEMMTRAPVKVTLSQGPYHVAQFRNSDREFDLTREDHLEQLRNEIELRMRNSVRDGKTVSKDEIALTVKGPSLPRMVLVDLPGVISTVTTEMAQETKDDIVKICRQYMENPNAIILCIQDGSIDAERSNVTDIVSSMDPDGHRTILVLTKVDLAEKLSNPDRIKKILEGRLFPMKALGYFGVVTGKGSENSSIEEIRKYEEDFFAKSKLFRDGILKATQMTTKNMSLAVSDCFWRMVRESIESQADAFRALRFNLETEWKNTFIRRRELCRDELFDKARGEILDEIVNLSLVGANEWESTLRPALWASFIVPAFDHILMPACNTDSTGPFNTHIEINLKHWAEKELANKSIQVGWDTLSQVFRKQVEEGARSSKYHHPSAEHYELLKPLKKAVIEAVLDQHKWDSKALDYLRVIQLSAIDDRVVPDQRSWQEACDFMANSVLERREEVMDSLKAATGNRGWFRRSVNQDQALNESIQNELVRLLAHNPDHKQALLDEDLTVVRSQLGSHKDHFDAELTNERIRQQWRLVYRQHFLDRMYRASGECKYLFQNYKQGAFGVTSDDGHSTSSNGGSDMIDCQAVTFFYRINKMLGLSANALRQQIMNTEQRRLEKEVKDILDDWSQDPQKKRQYLTGRQVELAEELAQVRHIQDKLEEFIVQLHQEKS